MTPQLRPGREFGECTVCHKTIALRKGGTLFAHRQRGSIDQWCQGSSLPPVTPGKEVILRVVLDAGMRSVVKSGCDRLNLSPADLARAALLEYLCRH